MPASEELPCGNCEICKAHVAPVFGEDGSEYVPAYYFCPNCMNRYPQALRKALVDPFFYAAGIKELGVVEFETARIKGDWVTLIPHDGDVGFRQQNLPYPFPRNIDVPLANILWVADAPDGS